jgi:TIR domain
MQTDLDVYISAGKDDCGAAEWLCDCLEQHAIRCWVSSRDDDPALSSGRIDYSAVKASRLMITIHSAAGDRRATSIEERRFAFACALPTLPIEAADVPQGIDIDSLLVRIRTILNSVLPVRVFIWAAKGTEEEQQQVLGLFDGVQQNIRGRVRLEPVFWDPSQTIAPSNLDIVVFLLWDCLHTGLPRPWSETSLNAWIRVNLVPKSATLLYYKTSGGSDERPMERLTALREMTASVNEAIDRWLLRSGKRFLEFEDRTPFESKSQPKFIEDFCNYLNEYVKTSLILFQGLEMKREVEVPAGLTAFSGVALMPIPNRFKEIGYGRQAKRGPRDESSEPPPPPVTKTTVLRKAHFSAFAPATVTPNSEFILEIWACRESSSEYSKVFNRATRERATQEIGHKESVPVALASWLTVSVSIPVFGPDPLQDQMYWTGDITNTSFAVKVPENALPGSYIGSAQITSEVVPVAILHFQVTVAKLSSPVSPLESEERTIRSIFASYASEDRAEVLQWARGAEAVGVDVFIDAVASRSGADWQKELFRQVPSRDLFSLFWSKPASRSRWVEMEWRCALAVRGLDYIHPVALADPRMVPPPQELAAKHFNDPKVALIDYEKGFSKWNWFRGRR